MVATWLQHAGADDYAVMHYRGLYMTRAFKEDNIKICLSTYARHKIADARRAAEASC